MATVTSTIKRILKDQAAGIIDGQDAVLQLLGEVRREILAELSSGHVGSYTALQMRQSLASIERYLQDFESAADRELGSRIATAWAKGAELVPATLQLSGSGGALTGFGSISAHLVDALKEFAFGRIASVSSDLHTKIKGELTLGILGQKTPQQVMAVIAGDIEGVAMPKNRFGGPVFKSAAERAEVITQTEMGRAFSMATSKSLDQAQGTVPDLQKMWLHAGHPGRPRLHHLALHGAVREMDKPFYSSPAVVMYPHDPEAPIKEVIRCGCTHIPYMAAWGDAETFSADFDKHQAAANRRA